MCTLHLLVLVLQQPSIYSFLHQFFCNVPAGRPECVSFYCVTCSPYPAAVHVMLPKRQCVMP
jgi:hypothetical protein